VLSRHSSGLCFDLPARSAVLAVKARILGLLGRPGRPRNPLSLCPMPWSPSGCSAERASRIRSPAGGLGHPTCWCRAQGGRGAKGMAPFFKCAGSARGLPCGAGACGWRSSALGRGSCRAVAMAPNVVLYDSADTGGGRGVSEGFGCAAWERAGPAAASCFSSLNHALADSLDFPPFSPLFCSAIPDRLRDTSRADLEADSSGRADQPPGFPQPARLESLCLRLLSSPCCAGRAAALTAIDAHWKPHLLDQPWLLRSTTGCGDCGWTKVPGAAKALAA